MVPRSADPEAAGETLWMASLGQSELSHSHTRRGKKRSKEETKPKHLFKQSYHFPNSPRNTNKGLVSKDFLVVTQAIRKKKGGEE